MNIFIYIHIYIAPEYTLVARNILLTDDFCNKSGRHVCKWSRFERKAQDEYSLALVVLEHLSLQRENVNPTITLQHTATHCNTLQHTATHCNTLSLFSTCYSSMKLYIICVCEWVCVCVSVGAYILYVCLCMCMCVCVRESVCVLMCTLAVVVLDHLSQQREDIQCISLCVCVCVCVCCACVYVGLV